MRQTDAQDMRMAFLSTEDVTRRRIEGTTEGEFRAAGTLAGQDLVREFKRRQGSAHNPIAARRLNWFLTGLAAALINETQFNFDLPGHNAEGDSQCSAQ